MQNRTIGALALAGFVLAALGTAALADRRGPDGMRGEGPFAAFDFATVDADADGRVTEAELTAWRAARVAAMDANADGMLSEDEIKAGHMARSEARAEERAARMVAAHDVNGDGLLSVAELGSPPVPVRLFARVDTDGDGAITEAELDAVKGRMAQKGRHHHMQDKDE
jgi:Ca2+-binding EF-hand superfamily protein